MKKLRRFKEVLNTDRQNSEHELVESLVGKGVAISNNRQHAANKTKLFSLISQIQNHCRQGGDEDDQNDKIDLLFQIAFEFAGALKIFAEMSTNNNNISTTAVLDAENIQKVLEKALTKPNKK